MDYSCTILLFQHISLHCVQEKSLINISDDQGFSVNYRANYSLIFFCLMSLRITLVGWKVSTMPEGMNILNYSFILEYRFVIHLIRIRPHRSKTAGTHVHDHFPSQTGTQPRWASTSEHTGLLYCSFCRTASNTSWPVSHRHSA